MRPGDDLARLVAELKRGAERLRRGVNTDDRALVQALWRPELGALPPRLRPLLEPVVAGLGLGTLVLLAGTGTLALLVLGVVALLFYLIVTYVFGIQLDLGMPTVTP